MNNTRPILVTGSHRSGTTWVGKMLSLSPDVAYIQEPMNPNHRRGECRADFRYWFPQLDHASGETFKRDLRDCLDFRYDPMSALSNARSIKSALRIPYDAGRCLFSRMHGKRPLMKDPIALLSAEWLAEEFDMDVIMMIRHPAAFVGSLKRTGWNFPFHDLVCQNVCGHGPLNRFQDEVEHYARERQNIVKQGILLWNLFHTVIRDYQIRHPKWHFVRHEDLSLSPVKEFTALFNALGLDFSEKNRQLIEASTQAKHTGHEALHSVKRDSRKTVESWRERLNAEEIDHVKSGTAELTGYFYFATDYET